MSFVSKVNGYLADRKWRKIREGCYDYLKKTDFSLIDVSSMPKMSIEYGSYEYPLFHMFFVRNVLNNIVYCLSKGYCPEINILSAETGLNLWEQFCLQPYELIEENDDFEKPFSKSIPICDVANADLPWPLIPSRADIVLYGKLIKKFLRLNQKTKEYFINEEKQLLGEKRILGVLCRGTDYTSNKPAGHPIQPEIEEIINKSSQIMDEYNLQYIYLATDEENSYKLFEKAFPGKIIVNKRQYYDSFYRIKEINGNNTRISWVHFDRKNDNFCKSLEYFSSVNLLSKCSALVAGNCGGSRAALYLNENQYEYSYLFDLGTY